MIFTSPEFFLFLAVTLAFTYGISNLEFRKNYLLLASYFFYGWWDYRYCSLLLFSTVIDFYLGKAIHRSGGKKKLAYLRMSLFCNLGLLAFFKYSDFLTLTINSLLGHEALPYLGLILPVGISFFTFQTMSYSIDIYRGTLEPAKNLRDFALFVSFFPQLVAGPIVRASEFLYQLDSVQTDRKGDFIVGMDQFARGFAKKVLFANTLAVYVDPVFADPELFSSTTMWLALLAYSGQIYYDFSGYTDMAIGVGRMLGYKFPENFRHPYLSQNITEFWRRWHLSLSLWLRDYLYISLGGNRVSFSRTQINLMLTMVLGGLWHGASWAMIVWGALHGLGLVIHRLIPKKDFGLAGKLSSWTLTKFFLLLTWVVFRGGDFHNMGLILSKMFAPTPGADWFFVPAILVMLASTILHIWVLLRKEKELTLGLKKPEGWVLLLILFGLCLWFAPLEITPFIYFQF